MEPRQCRHHDSAPIVSVHERLPETILKTAQEHQRERTETTQTSAPVQEPLLSFGDEDWDPNVYPLVIGLGPMAERIVPQVSTRVPIPDDAGLYRTGAGSGDDAADWLALRLENCAAALLLIDAADPDALAEASVWTNQLAVSDVYLRAAVLLNTRGRSVDSGLAWSLPTPFIEVHICEQGENAAGIVHALLPGLPFNAPAAMCYGLDDIRSILSLGRSIRTTAVRWTQPADLRASVTNACAVLNTARGRGAVAWLNTGVGYFMDEWESRNAQLDEYLAPDAERMVIPVPTMDLPESERVLSLTAVGG